MEWATEFKYLLTRVGRFLSPTAIYNLNASLNYLEVGRWMQAAGLDIPHRVERRELLFELVAQQVSARVVLYLEFGVFKGDSIRYWSSLLHNPESKLHGFDSFEGLPEAWASHAKGYLSVDGQIPKTDDSRVKFFKGWFEHTLPNYEFPPHELLVVVLDADLYSSTKCVLNALEKVIVPGTYVYFDNFNHRYDELRAFEEFTERTGMEFSVVSATRCLGQVMFRRR
jgi:Macrocin-O-methyltransferase (TylF)